MAVSKFLLCFTLWIIASSTFFSVVQPCSHSVAGTPFLSQEEDTTEESGRPPSISKGSANVPDYSTDAFAETERLEEKMRDTLQEEIETRVGSDVLKSNDKVVNSAVPEETNSAISLTKTADNSHSVLSIQADKFDTKQGVGNDGSGIEPTSILKQDLNLKDDEEALFKLPRTAPPSEQVRMARLRLGLRLEDMHPDANNINRGDMVTKMLDVKNYLLLSEQPLANPGHLFINNEQPALDNGVVLDNADINKDNNYKLPQSHHNFLDESDPRYNNEKVLEILQSTDFKLDAYNTEPDAAVIKKQNINVKFMLDQKGGLQQNSIHTSEDGHERPLVSVDEQPSSGDDLRKELPDNVYSYVVGLEDPHAEVDERNDIPPAPTGSRLSRKPDLHRAESESEQRNHKIDSEQQKPGTDSEHHEPETESEKRSREQSEQRWAFSNEIVARVSRVLDNDALGRGTSATTPASAKDRHTQTPATPDRFNSDPITDGGGQHEFSINGSLRGTSSSVLWGLPKYSYARGGRGTRGFGGGLSTAVPPGGEQRRGGQPQRGNEEVVEVARPERATLEQLRESSEEKGDVDGREIDERGSLDGSSYIEVSAKEINNRTKEKLDEKVVDDVKDRDRVAISATPTLKDAATQTEPPVDESQDQLSLELNSDVDITHKTKQAVIIDGVVKDCNVVTSDYEATPLGDGNVNGVRMGVKVDQDKEGSCSTPSSLSIAHQLSDAEVDSSSRGGSGMVSEPAEDAGVASDQATETAGDVILRAADAADSAGAPSNETTEEDSQALPQDEARLVSVDKSEVEANATEAKDTKEKDAIETYSQFAERVAMEKMNDGNGNTGGVGGAVGSPSSLKNGKAGAVTAKYNTNKNYAGIDCGSKLLAANAESQRASKVIQPNRDEYLLTDCNAKTWFVVELCESIRPSKIQIANFELFSNLPRDMAAYGSQRYPTRDWMLLGTYMGQEGNRGLQSFPVNTDTFFKYIKMEISSHYGTEYYCPVSLFRVFGVSEFEVIDSMEEGADGLDEEQLEPSEDEDMRAKEEKKGRSMLPTVLRSMLTNVLGVLNRGASLSITSNKANQTPAVDECTSLDPRYKIDEKKCSLAPTINWHLGCYDIEYKYVLKLPIVKKVVENREFCKSLVDNLCTERVNKEMREQDESGDTGGLSGSQVDFNYACSTRVCGNNYVCVMLCSHHLLALCHIKHYTLAVAATTNNASVDSTAKMSSCTTEASVLSENISTNSNIVANGRDIGKKRMPKYIIRNGNDSILDTVEAGLQEDTSDVKHSDDFLTGSLDLEKETQMRDSVFEHSDEVTGERDVSKSTNKSLNSDGKSDISKKEKDSKPISDGDKKANGSKEKKTIENKRLDAGHNAESSGPRSPEGNGKNGSPLPTVEQDPSSPPVPAMEHIGNGYGLPAAPPNKESVVVRLSNKIKVLEHNLSISSQYLEELSQRYKRQMEDMQRQFSAAVTTLNSSTRNEDERDRQRGLEQRMEIMQGQMEELTKLMTELTGEHEGLATRVVEQHLFLMFLEVLVLLLVLYVCMKRHRHQLQQQQLTLAHPPPSIPHTTSPAPADVDSSSDPVSQQNGALSGTASLKMLSTSPCSLLKTSAIKASLPLSLDWRDASGPTGSQFKRPHANTSKVNSRMRSVPSPGKSALLQRRRSIDIANKRELVTSITRKARRGSIEDFTMAGSYSSLLLEAEPGTTEIISRRRRKRIAKITPGAPTASFSRGSKATHSSFDSKAEPEPISWASKRPTQPTVASLQRVAEGGMHGSLQSNLGNYFNGTGNGRKRQGPESGEAIFTERPHSSSSSSGSQSCSRSRSVSGKKSNGLTIENLVLSKLASREKGKVPSKESQREANRKNSLNKSSAGVLFTCENSNNKSKKKKKSDETSSVPLHSNNNASVASHLHSNGLNGQCSAPNEPDVFIPAGPVASGVIADSNMCSTQMPVLRTSNATSRGPLATSVPFSALFVNRQIVNYSDTLKSMNRYCSSPVSTCYGRHDFGLMRISECSESSSAHNTSCDLELPSEGCSPVHACVSGIQSGVVPGPRRNSDGMQCSSKPRDVMSYATSCRSRSDDQLNSRQADHLNKDTTTKTNLLSNVTTNGSYPSREGDAVVLDQSLHQLSSTLTYNVSAPSCGASENPSVSSVSFTNRRSSWVNVTDKNHPLFNGDHFPELSCSKSNSYHNESGLTKSKSEFQLVSSSSSNRQFSKSKSRNNENKVTHKRSGSDGSPFVNGGNTARLKNLRDASVNKKRSNNNNNKRFLKRHANNSHSSYGSTLSSSLAAQSLNLPTFSDSSEWKGNHVSVGRTCSNDSSSSCCSRDSGSSQGAVVSSGGSNGTQDPTGHVQRGGS